MPAGPARRGFISCDRDLMRCCLEAWEERVLALLEQQQEQLLLSGPSGELLWVSGDRAKSISMSFIILSELVIGRAVSKEGR